MAIVPAPQTWVNGTSKVNATTLNLELRDALNFLLSPPRVWAYDSTVLSVANNVSTLMSWNAEVLDSDNMHNSGTNPSRITCNAAGLFHVDVGIAWTANGTGSRITHIRKNSAGSATGGTQLFDFTAMASPNTFSFGSSFDVDLIVGDYIEVFVQQISGGSLSTTGINQYENYIQAFWIAKSS